MTFNINDFETEMRVENMNHPVIVAELIKNGISNYNIAGNGRLERKWARVQECRNAATNEDKACYYQDELDLFAAALIRYSGVQEDSKKVELPKSKGRATNQTFVSFVNSANHCADEDLTMDERYKNGYYEKAVNLR